MIFGLRLTTSGEIAIPSKSRFRPRGKADPMPVRFYGAMSVCIAAVFFGCLVWWLRGNVDPEPSRPPGESEYTSASSRRQRHDLEYTHFSNIGDDTAIKGPLLENGIVHEYDQLRIDATLAEPTHYFLVAINPDGNVQLCHPSNVDIAPQVTQQVRFPTALEQGFGFTDGPGQQVFMIVTSSVPLPSFSEWSAATDFASALEDWKSISGDEISGSWVWEDGTLFSDLRRGAVKPLAGTASFVALCKRVTDLPHVDRLYAVTFRVAPRIAP